MQGDGELLAPKDQIQQLGVTDAQMEPLQRVAFAVGIFAGLATIYSFLARLPDPLNYSMFGFSVVVLLLAAFWHRLRPEHDKPMTEMQPSITPEKRPEYPGRTKKLYDKSFKVKKGEYEPFSFDCVRGDVVSIVAESDGAFDWYIFDPSNFSKFQRGLMRFEWEDAGTNTLSEKKDFKARKYGPFYLVIDNVEKVEIHVNLIMTLTYSKL